MKRLRTGVPNLLEDTLLLANRRGAPWWGKMLFAVLAVAISGGLYYSFVFATKVTKALSAVTAPSNAGLLSQIKGLANPPEKQLQGEAQNRVNVILLGIGGAGHDGPLLADTIIAGSFQPSTHQIGLMSIPRDFIVEIPGYGFRKINNANAFGEEKGRGAGAVLTASVLEKVLSAPIQYYVRVDFSGFEKFIDDIGGIDVTVDTTFTDTSYPTENYGYQTIHFTAGRQHFDGVTALKFVRSRHGDNAEGSDFARSRRQQKVLLAMKKKIFSFETLLNPSRITKVLDTLGAHVVTNFQPWELMRLVSIGKTVKTDAVTTRVLDTTPDGLLVNTVGLDGAYILEPRAKNYSEIQTAFASLFTETQQQKARITIQNGTTIAGLATSTATRIASSSIEVVRTQNAVRRNVATTIIYDLVGGQKPAALSSLKQQLHANVVTVLPNVLGAKSETLNLSDIQSSLTNGETLRGFQDDPAFSGIDFVVVLGTDQATNH
ncbi:MAG: LCP family protein [bacterium]